MIFLLLIYALIFIINVPGLVKKKEWRELTFFSILYIIAFTLGLLYVLDVHIPSPMKGLQYLIVDILGIKYQQ
ncbi:MAG TPA: hypothetical protein PK033_11135 [Acetivibrio sp.]|jgi:ABC-type Mn2+/Zn2+ transport system permease subunit|nr:hypothetical protein [Clostridium sp.]HOQ38221.1 hypothetical protein [Acetivibrio sp.]HPT90869.1 hypothetical protein [Acetivibrio sp.]HQA58414.1 hypothetical protein [Acetivibrio sp.]